LFDHEGTIHPPSVNYASCRHLVTGLCDLDFTGYIPIDGQPITPNFKFTRVVNISYPNGGKLKDALDGQNQTISFTLDNSNPSVQKLMQDMQSAMTATGSTAKITGLKLNYVAQINGHSTEASITYLIQVIPTIENYVIYKGTVTTVSGVMGGARRISWMPPGRDSI